MDGKQAETGTANCLPAVGSVVCWQRIGGEWATGTVLGSAPCFDSKGGPVVEVQASNGRVYVAVSVLV